MIRYIAVATLALMFFVAGVAFARADETTYRVQVELNKRGYDVGVPDGVYGPATGSAIERFQRDAGCNVTGEPSKCTLGKLFTREERRDREEAVDDILSGGTAAAITIDRRAYGRCGELTVANGEKKYLKRRAEQDAIRVWKTDVANRYGTSYVEWQRAQDAKVRCRPACATCTVSFECEVAAVPCRDE